MKQYGRLLVASTLLIIASCKKEDNAGPSTNNTTGTATSFEGNWSNMENSDLFGSSTYPLVIESDKANQIYFGYLYGFKTKTAATISGNSFFINTPQIIEGNSVSGSGVMVNLNQINMTYVVDNGVQNDTITAILTRN